MKGREMDVIYSIEWILREELDEVRNKGRVQGERKAYRLIENLHNSGQLDLLPEILRNEELKEELYQKFQIS